MVDDARTRTLAWLNTYIDNANITALDDSTPLTLHLSYGKPNYNLKYVFWGTKNNDVIFSVQDPEVTPLNSEYSKSAYGYIEKVPIEIYAVDKDTTIGGLDSCWKAEQELRTAQEDHPLGSVRSFSALQPNSRDMGGWILYSKRCVMEYKRASSISPTTPSITWGPSASPTGTYIFPNCISVDYPSNEVADVKILPPSRKGDIKQNSGDHSITVQLTCDLEIEPDALTWKRPQTETPKTDALAFEVLLDIKHNGTTQEYQTLTLDWGTFQVRLVDFQIHSSVLTVVLEEYNSSSASSTYLDRWGIT